MFEFWSEVSWVGTSVVTVDWVSLTTTCWPFSIKLLDKILFKVSWETFLTGLEAVLGILDALGTSDKEILTVLQYCKNSEAFPEDGDSVCGTEELVLVALESAASGLPMY